MSALPKKPLTKSESKVIQYFDNYFNKPVEIAVSEYDAVLGFFEKRGFGILASRTISQVLLTQAKVEGVKIFTLLDSLGGLDKRTLSSIVVKVINLSRDKTSQLGFKTTRKNHLVELRNLQDPLSTSLNINAEEDIVIDTNTYITPDYVELGYVE